MRAQYGPQFGLLYIIMFILLVGLGGYWILHSNTWVDYNILYGPTFTHTGMITRFDNTCDDDKRILFMMDTGTQQAFVYAGFKPDIMVGDRVAVTAYNVTGRGLVYDLTRSRCEPDGFHYYAIKIYNTRTAMSIEGRPWQK